MFRNSPPHWWVTHFLHTYRKQPLSRRTEASTVSGQEDVRQRRPGRVGDVRSDFTTKRTTTFFNLKLSWEHASFTSVFHSSQQSGSLRNRQPDSACYTRQELKREGGGVEMQSETTKQTCFPGGHIYGQIPAATDPTVTPAGDS